MLTYVTRNIHSHINSSFPLISISINVLFTYIFTQYWGWEMFVNILKLPPAFFPLFCLSNLVAFSSSFSVLFNNMCITSYFIKQQPKIRHILNLPIITHIQDQIGLTLCLKNEQNFQSLTFNGFQISEYNIETLVSLTKTVLDIYSTYMQILTWPKHKNQNKYTQKLSSFFHMVFILLILLQNVCDLSAPLKVNLTLY